MENKKGIVINLEEEYNELFNILVNKINYLQIKEQLLNFAFDLEIKESPEKRIKYFQNIKIISQCCKESSDKELIRLAEAIEKSLSRSHIASKPDFEKYGFIDLFKGFFKLLTGQEEKVYVNISKSIENITEHVFEMLEIIEIFEGKTNRTIVLPS
ncbi:hypothetical protein [Bacillus cereus group sp. TH152-1LC]|uniref:hypothetical protein n=1 Tax=Bacillus cereus group sp. TH152-1LC TaxID=3018060 RepID=UPI0022E96AB6|nr:hypothetical protein [Bacillus cereus group sp. TH152-1LC]MDA1675583.1 hypothetical protein [Bacillus cereus group sp. TH152-1LC]